MNILMTADAVGGVWTYALELACALEPYGVGVTLAVMGPAPTPAQLRAAAALPNVAIYHSPYKLEWMDEPWEDVERAADWLGNIAVRSNADIVHVNGYSLAARRWQQPVLVVVHSCVVSWWRAVHMEDAPPQYATYRERVTRGLQRADMIVAPTRAIASQVLQHYGVGKPALIIPNARDHARFHVAEKQPFILSVGRTWDRMKNISALDAVAPQLDWRVYVAGQKTAPDASRIDYRGVKMLGLLSEPELAGWYARAAIFAHPARYEPFGLAPLEAALSRCALVLSDIDTLREVWGHAALYVDPDDPAALREALQRLIDSAPLRDDLAERAYERALSYTPARMATSYLSVYSTLMRRAAQERVPCA